MGLGIRSGLIYPVVGRMPAGYTDPISGYQSRPDYSAGHKGSADIPNQPSRENTRKSDIHAWDKKKLWSVQNGFLGSDSAQCWPARSFSRIFFYSTQHYFSLSISRLGSIQERKKIQTISWHCPCRSRSVAGSRTPVNITFLLLWMAPQIQNLSPLILIDQTIT